MWGYDPNRPAGETLYFGGSLAVQDLLDFDLWRHEADKLGIKLTQEDIRSEINREAFDFQPLEADAGAALTRIYNLLRSPRQANMTIEDVYTALGDELRVSLAQSAILGYPPGVRYYRYAGTDYNHVPATPTAEQFWEYYQDHRTTLRVEMLPIKVEDFLAKVGKPPADAEPLTPKPSLPLAGPDSAVSGDREGAA